MKNLDINLLYNMILYPILTRCVVFIILPHLQIYNQTYHIFIYGCKVSPLWSTK